MMRAFYSNVINPLDLFVALVYSHAAISHHVL